jgi:hypothetical protein
MAVFFLFFAGHLGQVQCCVQKTENETNDVVSISLLE